MDRPTHHQRRSLHRPNTHPAPLCTCRDWAVDKDQNRSLHRPNTHPAPQCTHLPPRKSSLLRLSMRPAPNPSRASQLSGAFTGRLIHRSPPTHNRTHPYPPYPSRTPVFATLDLAFEVIGHFGADKWWSSNSIRPGGIGGVADIHSELARVRAGVSGLCSPVAPDASGRRGGC